ncbi:restriction endonuclease subunit S [Enterococcus faecium]|uniref:restriction endonuclease subunit S n=1 Tax=Enterococcus faecium TaxID=1352 RepID=UPI0035666CA1
MSNDTQPEIRFPGFTEAWKQRKLREVSKIGDIDHRMPPSVDDGIPYLMTGDFIEENELNFENTKLVSEDDYLQLSKKIRPEYGDILFARYASVGAVRYVSTHRKFLISYSCAIIKPFSDIDGQFLYPTLKTQKMQQKIEFEINPNSQKNIGIDSLKKLPLFIPKMDEQQKIGTFFKQLDDTIALHQRKLDLLKETKKGFLQKMFPKNGAKVPEIRFPGFTGDWEQRKLNDFISGDISDGDWIEKEHIKDEGKYRIIQTGNIGNGVYIDKEKSAKYMDQNSFDILKANEIFPGDLLVSRLAEPAGRTVILPNIEDRMVTAVDVTILRQNENFDAYFLLSQMNTSKILNKVSKNVSGTSHKRISRKNLEKVTIDSTSIEEQNKIGAFFKQLDDTIALHQRKLDLLKETKKGFLQKMFV